MKNILEKKLHDFLIKNNCLYSFLEYTNANEIKKALKYSPEDTICYTFEWHRTKEDSFFWSQINDNWLYYLSNNRIINKKDKTFKIFMRFLKENNIYKKYLNNAKIRFPYMSSRNFIGNAFHWEMNEYHLWSNIDEKWRNIYKEL